MEKNEKTKGMLLSISFVIEKKWKNIFLFLIFGFALGYVYFLIAPKLYKSEILLIPGQTLQSVSSQPSLSSLLTGGMPESTDILKNILILKSKSFLGTFLNDVNAEKTVLTSDELLLPPQNRKQITYTKFLENNFQLTYDRINNSVLIEILTQDPKMSSAWANLLISRLNKNVQSEALTSIQKNIKYLLYQYDQVKLVVRKQAISSLIEREEGKKLVTQGNEEFAFKVLDPATEALNPSSPRLFLSLLIGLLMGLVIGVGFNIYKEYEID
jgi:uncharacterized protein involved in exopolysaccharide biosynthesis